MSYGEDLPDARRGGRLVTFAVALVAVVMLAGGIWLAYDRGLQRGNNGTPPLIKADNAPTKVAPANPGGLQVPNQNIEVYSTVQRGGQGQKGGVEKLLPPPEQPLPEAPKPAAAPKAAAPSAAPAPAPAAQPAPNAVVSLPAAPPPQVVKTPEPAPQQQATVKPAPAPAPAPPPAPAPAIVLKPPPAPAPAPVAAPVVAPSGAGGIRVQLAAHREQAQATAEWTKLQKKFPEVLGSLSPTYERADLGDRGIFIRVQAGPFNDRAAAQSTCDRLKAGGQACAVVGR